MSSVDGPASELIRKDRAHVWHHLTQHAQFDSTDPLVIVEANGMRIRDARGREYLDATSGGLWTVNIGYGRKRMARAVYDQLVKMAYFAGSGGTQPGVEFAEALLAKMPGLSRVYYSNSGSEANEKAFKIVRQLSAKCHDGMKRKIIYRERDYHGTTLGALSATGQFERKHQYGPFVPGFVSMPHCLQYRSRLAGSADFGKRAAQELERVLQREDPDSVGAVILEPITAGGGVITPPEGYWDRIQAICGKYQIILIIDEVVCGFGRTGKWFGYQHYGIRPDIVTMAKGVASGYAAISCTVTTEQIFEQFKLDAEDRMDYFRDVSTFGGCAAGPAAALQNMQIIEEERLIENATAVGERLRSALLALKSKHRMIGDVRGKGLFQGIELVADRGTKEPVDESTAARLVSLCQSRGVIVGRTNRSFRTYNNTLTLSPALIATPDDIDEIADALDYALQNV